MNMEPYLMLLWVFIAGAFIGLIIELLTYTDYSSKISRTYERYQNSFENIKKTKDVN
jgi:hypothetical protein